MEIGYKIVQNKRYQMRNQPNPLKMRVYNGRNYKTCPLGIDILENDWNEQLQLETKSNSNHKLYNVNINTLKATSQKSIFLNEDEDHH